MPARRQHAEGSLFQRSRDGKWVAVADLGHRNGKRDRRYFVSSDSQEAFDRRQRFLERRRDGFTMPKGRPPYVSEWLLHWLYNVARPRVDASTWHKSYRSKVESLMVPFFERILLSELDEEDIEAWHLHLVREVSPRTGRPRSPATIAQAHRIMSSALKAAVVRKRMARNPCSNVTPPQWDPVEPSPPEEREVQSLLRECEDWRTGARWVTSIATGLRQGEALGLLWPYVDMDDAGGASVSVEWALTRRPWEHGCDDSYGCGGEAHRFPCPRPCPKVRVSGRPHACRVAGDPSCCPPGCTGHAKACPLRRDGGLRLKRPKSKKSRRDVPLATYAAASLRQWKRDQSAEQLAAPQWGGWAHDPQECRQKMRPGVHVCPGCMLPARPGLLVFTTTSGLPVDPRHDWQDWDGLLGAAGLEHYRVHDNRHGFGTMLLEAGMDIRVVQELMGHSTPDFTQRTYQHVRKKLRTGAAEAIDRALRGGG